MVAGMPAENVLTVEIAKKFVSDPDSVDLAVYSEIEDGAMPVLVQHGGSLRLDGFKTIPLPALETLSQYKGAISLGGISELSDEAARTIARGACKVALWNLAVLTNQPGHVELASRLAEEGCLSIPKLTELPAEIATAFVEKGKLERLRLSGVVELSKETAGILSRHKGEL